MGLMKMTPETYTEQFIEFVDWDDVAIYARNPIQNLAILELVSGKGNNLLDRYYSQSVENRGHKCDFMQCSPRSLRLLVVGRLKSSTQSKCGDRATNAPPPPSPNGAGAEAFARQSARVAFVCADQALTEVVIMIASAGCDGSPATPP
jgi:hypothetical protein